MVMKYIAQKNYKCNSKEYWSSWGPPSESKFSYLARLPNNLVFDTEGKFLFFPINKAAQTSIVRGIFKDRAVVRKDDVEKWEVFTKYYLNEGSLSSLVSFGVCRHPISKFISAYFYLLNKNLIPDEGDMNKYLLKHWSPSTNPNKINLHFQVQYKNFFYKGGLLPNYLIKLENINEDLPLVLNKVGINSELPHKNKGLKKDYSNLLNKHSLNLLGQVYHQDLSLLNYLND